MWGILWLPLPVASSWKGHRTRSGEIRIRRGQGGRWRGGRAPAKLLLPSCHPTVFISPSASCRTHPAEPSWPSVSRRRTKRALGARGRPWVAPPPLLPTYAGARRPQDGVGRGATCWSVKGYGGLGGGVHVRLGRYERHVAWQTASQETAQVTRGARDRTWPDMHWGAVFFAGGADHHLPTARSLK